VEPSVILSVLELSISKGMLSAINVWEWSPHNMQQCRIINFDSNGNTLSDHRSRLGESVLYWPSAHLLRWALPSEGLQQQL